MADRCTLVLFNTVERLLRGDFFHVSEMEDVTAALGGFPQHWPVVGLGTSNWYKRNGELVVGGDCETPAFYWGDPTTKPPGRKVDLAAELPEGFGADDLVTPEVGKDDTFPRFPFVCAAACRPEDEVALELPQGRNIEEWLNEEMAERNIGLCAIQGEMRLSEADYTTCCHIPIGGFAELEGDIYSAFKEGTVLEKMWDLRGLYALNPTVQKMISVEGHPLHLHGHTDESQIAGHLTKALPEATGRIRMWPIQDLKLTIRDLNAAWLPVAEEVQEG